MCETWPLAKKVETYKDILVFSKLFPLPTRIDKGKPFEACTGTLLISLKSQNLLLNKKFIKYDLVNLLCYMGDLYCQLNQFGTCFAFLPVQHLEHGFSSLIQPFFRQSVPSFLQLLQRKGPYALLKLKVHESRSGEIKRNKPLINL